MADLHITVDGRDGDAESLQDWLRGEPEFRGHLRQGETPGPDGAMGAVVDVIVGVVSSGAATTLAKSLQVAGPGGREVVLDAKRIPDAERLVNTVLGWTEGDPPASLAAG
jgi:hypothetical protein